MVLTPGRVVGSTEADADGGTSDLFLVDAELRRHIAKHVQNGGPFAQDIVAPPKFRCGHTQRTGMIALIYGCI